jgi:hypothetical protein
MHKEIATAQSEQRPWLYLIVGLPSVIGNFAVFAFSWLQGSRIEAVPYYWVPLAMMLAAALVLAFESANSWLPEVPGVFRRVWLGWAKFLVAPVLAPIGHWKSIRKPKPAGEQVGVVAATVSTFWTFIVAVILWWIAVLPLVFIVAFAYDAVR